MSREVNRNGGRGDHRASSAEQAAWERAHRAKTCKLAVVFSLLVMANLSHRVIANYATIGSIRTIYRGSEMSSDPQSRLDKGLLLWESDHRAAEKIFVDVYWKHEGTPEADLAQAYLYNLRKGDPAPKASQMRPNFDVIEQGSQTWFRVQYQAIANVYLVVYALLMLPVVTNLESVFRSGFEFQTIIALVSLFVISLPAILLVPRVIRRYKHGEALISEEFARARTGGLRAGKPFIWIGTVGMLLSLAVILIVLLTRTVGMPAGLGIGLSMWPLMIGFLAIEFSYRRWARQGR